MRLLGALLVSALVSGCASNYDFKAARGQAGELQITRLSEDLEKLPPSDDSVLYDFTFLPLLHTNAQLCTTVEKENMPAGFAVVDLDAWLPLFGFVHVSIDRYDESQQLYESKEVDSYLWGLWKSEQEVVDTRHGLRQHTESSFLWIFQWEAGPTYVRRASGISTASSSGATSNAARPAAISSVN